VPEIGVENLRSGKKRFIKIYLDSEDMVEQNIQNVAT